LGVATSQKRETGIKERKKERKREEREREEDRRES
jgi:hypothetical protein